MSNFRSKLIHFILRNNAKPQPYTSTKQFPRAKYPERNRLEHANHLLSQLTISYNQKIDERKQIPKGAPAPDGIFLEFEGEAGADLDFKKLDLPKYNIELLNVKKIQKDQQEKTIATIFVPDDKIQVFIKRIEQYRDQETPTGKPKNNDLIRSISNIRVAVLKSLWTDLQDTFPESQEIIWWEIWLRATPEAIPTFVNFAKSRDINVSARYQVFPDRHIILAYTTAEMLSHSMDGLNFIAELRRAKETTKDFLQMRNDEQKQWSDSFLGLLDHPSHNSASVCILDTGINNQNPLINPFLSSDNLLTINPAWGATDHEGHGTAMAGLVLYGDLSTALLSNERIQIPCHIESVKILPPNQQNSPDLYGSITEEAISRATIKDPLKERIICMAVAATDARDVGQPSSWSAAIDNISVGQTIKDKQHLVILAAGNANSNDYINYPHANFTDGIHDPGQSWNALTVGAYTEKTHISEPSLSGWSPLAEAGHISPANTTSLTWENTKWPIKPDVVFEGGNAAIDSQRTTVDHPDSLALLSTHRLPIARIFTHMADTSAAAAQAAHMSAIIKNKYPDLWPETIRGIIVHSAEWTEAMKNHYPTASKQDRANMLRMCGYGVPNIERALWSASNSLTLIVQDELKPYDANSMNELNIHTLPWPVDILRELGETLVKMHVTLSYFIEPNPARRGWNYKFRYQSHGLRFDVKTSLETNQEFITRINKKHWDEEAGRASVTSKSDTSEWFFGERLRSKGSIHVDIWEGTAASLAERNQIAVFPVTGWWREMHSKGHTSKKARYSLIVTLSTPEITADIYTPVETLIMNEVQIKT